MANKGQIRSDCQALTHDIAGTGRTVAEWDVLINMANRDMLRDAPTAEAESTIVIVAASSVVDLPDTVAVSPTPALFDMDGGQLDRVSPRDNAPPALSGTPSEYAIRGRTLVFDSAPTADTTLRIRFSKLPPTLVVDSDIPVLDVQFHDGITYRAVAKAFRADRDPDSARYYEGLSDGIRILAVQSVLSRHDFRRSGEED